MRGLVVFALVLVILASLSFIVVSTKNINDIRTETPEKPKILDFSTFTTAVCESKGDTVHCKDEFFVNCNGETSKVSGVAECNGIKLEAPKALGFATFSKDWKDPRN